MVFVFQIKKHKTSQWIPFTFTWNQQHSGSHLSGRKHNSHGMHDVEWRVFLREQGGSGCIEINHKIMI
jgi:hypothetical protein